MPSSHTDVSAAEMFMKDSRCDNLVEETAAALNDQIRILLY